MYKRIEELCKQKGISGYRLCKDLGYSPSTMTELRKGRVKALSPDKVSAIAKYFDVSTDYILTGEIEKAPTLTSEDLTDEQIELVRLFRGADSAYRAAALALLRESEAAHKVQDA